MLTNAANVLCHLLRKVINPTIMTEEDLLKNANWDDVKNLALRQGVHAIIFDVVSKLPPELRPDRESLIRNWIGYVIAIEKYHKKHADAISDLSLFYEKNGIKMMLLKGWGLSLNYPQPNHRPSGDIDIWLYGKQKFADKILSVEMDIRPIKSSHHTIFQYKGVEVENHITFIETDCHKADGSEEILLDYAREPAIEVGGEKGNTILLPSANLNAFFLLRHSSAHFATENITLRHLLDWAFFVNKYHTDIDWEKLYVHALDKNMHIFLDCLNAICVDVLGFDSSCFPIHRRYPLLQKRIFLDILYPEFKEIAPSMRSNFVKYCYVKTKRQFANKWKYGITYKESFWSILLRFAWNRIRTPYSFGDIIKNKR